MDDNSRTSKKRHLQWLQYYNQVREEYKAKEPNLYRVATKYFFYELVAEKFNNSPNYVQNVLNRLVKEAR